MWFKKKAAAAEPTRVEPAVVQAAVAPPNGAQELVARWDAMIASSYTRLKAILDEAVAASEPLLDSIRTDLTPLVLPWNTIAPRVHEAREEVENFWNAISDEMSESGAFTHEMMQHEGSKRDLATRELELLHDRAYGGVMARAADRMREHALGTDAAAHACNHCGAMLDKVTPVSQSLNVECAYCRSMNTVNPGLALRLFAASGALHLANEAARPAGEAMRRIETQIKQYRNAKDVPLALLIAFEATSRDYWTTRLTTEARYNPDEAKFVAAKLDRYMKDALRTLRGYWQWREHEATLPS